MPTIVRLTRDLRPWHKGEDAVLVNPALVQQLLESGDAEDPRPFPPPDVAPAPGSVGVSPEPDTPPAQRVVRPQEKPRPDHKRYQSRKGR